MADYRSEILERMAHHRAELKKLDAALSVIDEIDHSRPSTRPTSEPPRGALGLAQFTPPDLLGDLPSKQPTFNERVENAARQLSKPFTVPEIEQKLIENGASLPNHPRKRIAMALGELEESAVVERADRVNGRLVFVVKPNGMQLSR